MLWILLCQSWLFGGFLIWYVLFQWVISFRRWQRWIFKGLWWIGFPWLWFPWKIHSILYRSENDFRWNRMNHPLFLPHHHDQEEEESRRMLVTANHVSWLDFFVCLFYLSSRFPHHHLVFIFDDRSASFFPWMSGKLQESHLSVETLREEEKWNRWYQMQNSQEKLLFLLFPEGQVWGYPLRREQSLQLCQQHDYFPFFQNVLFPKRKGYERLLQRCNAHVDLTMIYSFMKPPFPSKPMFTTVYDTIRRHTEGMACWQWGSIHLYERWLPESSTDLLSLWKAKDEWISIHHQELQQQEHMEDLQQKEQVGNLFSTQKWTLLEYVNLLFVLGVSSSWLIRWLIHEHIEKNVLVFLFFYATTLMTLYTYYLGKIRKLYM